jgi:hypothetical protein
MAVKALGMQSVYIHQHEKKERNKPATAAHLYMYKYVCMFAFQDIRHTYVKPSILGDYVLSIIEFTGS